MNPATRRSLMAVAAQKAQSHPADAKGPLTQGTSRYRQRLWAMHAAVIVLATLLLGAGLLTGQSPDSLHEDTPTIIEPPPDDPLPEDPLPDDPVPVDPNPIEPDPTDPDPTDDPPTDDLELVSIELRPSSLVMVPGQWSTVQAIGFYNNETNRPIPPLELSWSVGEGDGERQDPSGRDREQQVVNVASVEQSTGTVTANRPGQATLTASFQGAEESSGTAVITVIDDETDDPNSTTPAVATPTVPTPG